MRASVFILILVSFCFGIPGAVAQNHTIDSLRKELSGNPDTSHFQTHKNLCWQFLDLGLFDSAEAAANRFYREGEELESNRFMGEGRYFLGIALARRGGHEAEAVRVQTEALQFYEKDDNKTGEGFANLMIGYVYYSQKNFVAAQTYWLKSRDLFLQANNDAGLANVYTNLGAIEFENKNYQGARHLFVQALTIFKARRSSSGVSNCLSELANVCLAEYKITTDTFRKKQLADSALEFTTEALELARRNGDQHMVSQYWNAMAKFYVTIGVPDTALLYNDSAMEASVRFDSKNNIRDAFATYSSIWEQKGDYRKALDYYKDWALLNDSLSGAESVNKTAAAVADYEAQKIAQQVEYDKEKARLITLAVVVGLLLALALAIVAYRAYRRSKSYSQLLANQNSIITQKNADITDSIRYSKRIQQALLPDDKQVNRILGDGFVFYKPKDIISGDFYWLQERGGKQFFMAADCTGHGVPGALMSMISSTLLNETVIEKNLSDPGLILDEVRSGIIRSLRQLEEGGDQSGTSDGMDGALCVLNRPSGELLFAGAYNPLWIFRNNELIETPADKFPVGISGSDLKPFTTHRVPVQKGDMIYCFTDGYADQFGGPKGKKLKYSGLRMLLAGICTLSTHEQMNAIENYFAEWKGAHEQVDDVCLIGVRI